MMLRDARPDENAFVVAGKELHASTGPTAPPTKPTSKWTANAARIVLAPVDINTSNTTVRTACESPMASPMPAMLTRDVAPVLASPIASPAPAPVATSRGARATLEELELRESSSKDRMTVAGQACMDAWTAALETSRAYRALRKEWRRAKMKLDKRRSKRVSLEPAVPLIDQACDGEEGDVEEPIEEEEFAPAALSPEDGAAPIDPLGQEIDEVEEMERCVHDLERSEVEYAALTHAEAEQEEADAEEQEEEAADAIASAAQQSGPPASFGVLSFQFGKGRSRVARSVALSRAPRASASDKARAAAMKAKLEADMAAHESRRLALAEAQRSKQAEFERRRAAAKEKVEADLARRTGGGRADDSERRRVEAESRRTRQHEEEKRARLVGKEKKRRELEHAIEELRAKERANASQKKKAAVAKTTGH